MFQIYRAVITYGRIVWLKAAGQWFYKIKLTRATPALLHGALVQSPNAKY